MRLHFFTLCIVIFYSQSIFSGVTITGTRIIFPSNQSTVTIQLTNPDERPALVQTWLDDGDPRQIPDVDKIPFLITPPLTQIAAKKGQMLRLIAKDTKSLSKDRESLYWFNILDIPPSADKDDVPNKLQVSIRSRIKMLYRPVNLPMTQGKAFSAVQFKYIESTRSILINNPSPYYLSFYNIELTKDNESKVYIEPLMVVPYSSETFSPSISFKPKKLIYTLINDYGANQSYSFFLE